MLLVSFLLYVCIREAGCPLVAQIIPIMDAFSSSRGAVIRVTRLGSPYPLHSKGGQQDKQ